MQPISGMADTYSKDDEKSLIRAARDGDEAAWDELIERHRKKITYWAERIGNDQATQQDLWQEGVIRLMELVEQNFDLSRDNLLWTYAEEPVKQAMYKHLKGNEFVSLDPMQAKARGHDEERVEAVPTVESTGTLWERGKQPLPIDIVDLRQHVIDCLKDPVRASKWLVLTTLRYGDDNWHGRTEWDMIADDLRDPAADIGQPLGREPSIWERLRGWYGFEQTLPETWGDVCELFRAGKDKQGYISPGLTYVTSSSSVSDVEEARKKTVNNLKRWYHRVTGRIERCVPGGLRGLLKHIETVG